MSKPGPKKQFAPPRAELERLYQQMSMKQIAQHYGVCATVIHKRIHEYGITLKDVGKGGHRKKTGKVFSDSHKENISKALRALNLKGSKNPNWKGGKTTKHCIVCAKVFQVILARAEIARFCSYECAGQWRQEHFKREGNPKWRDGARVKVCIGCGETFHWNGEPFVNFQKRKFCSKSCADRHGFRYERNEHPNYNPEARRRNRDNRHAKWAREVITRDHATCQICGATDTELHAHHLESYADHPEKRLDIDNGITLCYACHWDAHELTDSATNLGDPKIGAKKGRHYRRWEGKCDQCGKFISKRLSDVKNKKNIFCSRSCAGRFRMANISDETRKRMSHAQKKEAALPS